MESLFSLMTTDSGPTPLPYLRADGSDAATPALSAKAVCKDASCLLETNIPLLSLPTDKFGPAHRVLDENYDFKVVNNEVAEAAELYTRHVPSMAVDNRLETFFQSTYGESCLF